MTELTEKCSSLERQIGYLEKSQEKALNSNLYDQAANLERQISDARLEKRKLDNEKRAIQGHNVKLEKKRISRKRKRSGKGGEKKGKKTVTVQSVNADSSTEPESRSEGKCIGSSDEDALNKSYDAPGTSQISAPSTQTTRPSQEGQKDLDVSSTHSAADIMKGIEEGVTDEQEKE